MPCEMNSPSSHDDTRRDRASLRVLLVEDSPVICGLIAGIVNDVPGVTVAERVGSEREAVAAIGRVDPDVVILDLQLRKGTGFGVLRAMRDMPHRPVAVVLTNFAIDAYRDAALELGARDFLDKSRDYDRLPGILDEIAAALTP